MILTGFPRLPVAALAFGRTGSWCLAAILGLNALGAAEAENPRSLYPALAPLYRDLHAHPELSFQESATAGKLAARLTDLGFEVTGRVGRTGVVGVLRNGAGPTVMLRTDMDALPVEEKTGLDYASRVTAPSATGETVPVMHACGHDLHMTVWIGAATWFARNRKAWSGTLLMVGQPAEEVGGGAKAMLDDGLFRRFPRPDAALAIHDSDTLAAGTVGLRAGPIMASADSVDLTVYGRGGHGARPETTVDPIVIASRIVVGLQTLVSRENSPFDPAVVTVGSFHAGTKHNIIPDQARLQLTVRAFRIPVRDRLLAGIERIARAEAEGAGAPQAPDVRVLDSTPPTSNDPGLTARILPALRSGLGEARTLEGPALMVAEDFSLYGQAGVPIVMIWVGATAPELLERSGREGISVPTLHSPQFAPEPEAAITTGVETLVFAARELFRSKGQAPAGTR